jgi:predicted transcriptional regulator
MHKIIQQLKDIRQEKMVTQADLGDKLGFPQSHVSKIEQGKTDPRLSSITDMARLLGHELVLVPRAMLPAVRALFSAEIEQKPVWQVDEDD